MEFLNEQPPTNLNRMIQRVKQEYRNNNTYTVPQCTPKSCFSPEMSSNLIKGVPDLSI